MLSDARAQSFLLREGKRFLWVERHPSPFHREQIPDYLTRVRKVGEDLEGTLEAILMAPDFGPGVRESLELIKIPVRFFTRGGVSPAEWDEPALWVEERRVAPRASEKSTSEPSVPTPPTSWNRLTREELREFIQLELDFALHRHP